MSVEKYHTSLDLFCTQLPKKNADILELTCGPGNITRYLLSHHPDLNILATDLSPEMIKLAKINNPTASFQLLDCRAVLELGTKFDAILCGFGLPYVSKEEAIQMICDAYISLNIGGLIYLSTMEDDYDKSGFKGSSANPHEGLIMYFHEVDYIVQALKDYGFEVVDISRVQYPDDKGESITDLIVIGKKITA